MHLYDDSTHRRSLSRRRFLTVAGVGIPVLTGVVGSTRGDANPDGDPEVVFSDRYETSGLAAAVSEEGDRYAFGVDSGHVLVYDQEGERQTFDLATDRSVYDLYVSENMPSFVFNSVDGDLFGRAFLETDEEWGIEYDGLWSIDTTPDLSTVVAGSYPAEGTGGAGLVTDGDVQWQQHFTNAAAFDVAITDDANYVAVGGAQYTIGAEYHGESGVRLYGGDGTEEWTEATDEDVISVGVSSQTNIVVAGTDDGQLLVYDLDGSELWNDQEAGGFIELSPNGDTIMGTHPGQIVAFEAETGDERWTVGAGGWYSPEFDMSEDGSRVLAFQRSDGEAGVIDRGSVLWQGTTSQGPISGAIAGDGSTWGMIIQDNESEEAVIAVYQDSSMT
jgi:WD40 repeat protein